MFPSSQSDMDKFCCNRSSCPKRRQHHENSSQQTSSIEEIEEKPEFSWNKFNQETQMSASITTTTSSEKTSMPTQTSNEKSSQAYFDRNNQNLSYCFNKICPSNSLQTSQLARNFQLNTIMIKCPSIVAKNQEHTRTQCCRKCKRLEQPSRNTSTISTVANIKCACKKLDITSSSSSSTTLENFPVKLNLKEDYVEHKMPLAKRKYPSKLYKPILAAPPTYKINEQLLCDKKKCKSLNIQKIDQYYSCSSDDSDDNTPLAKSFCSRKCPNTNRNQAILHLLHEVVNLLNKDNSSSQEEIANKAKTSPSKLKVEPKHDDVIPPTPGQLPMLTWPPPCLCYIHGLALDKDPKYLNIPLLRPYNLASTTTEEVQVPQPFVYEESESFKDCFSGNKSLDNTTDNLLCTCSNICPKHGILKRELQQPSFPCSCLTNNEENFTSDGQIKTQDIDRESNPSFVNKENLRSYEELGEPNRTDLHKVKDEKVNLDDEVLYDPCEPCQDCLSEYDDEEPSRTDLYKVKDEKMNLGEQDDEILYDPCEPCQDCLSEYDDEEPSRTDLHKTKKQEIKLEEVDEELFPHYVDKISLNSFNPNEPSPDSLVQYHDEEPNKSEKSLNLDEEQQSGYNEQIMYDPNEPGLDCLSEYDDEEPSWPKDTKKSPYIVETTSTTGRNIYNFLPEVDTPTPGDAKQIIRYESEEEYDSNYHEDESEFVEDEYELAKEIRAERFKKKKRNLNTIPEKQMVLATINKLEEGEGSPEEMKFFIDSLIMDLEAMEYARRKSQFEKNICKSKSCARESYPVTITEVTDLGVNSLYVKWKVHDCYGITGYEIYTDGYLTNRYYNSKHEAAVITQVDITLPHKITLVALASNNEDESIALICNLKNNKNKIKSLPWTTDVVKDSKSLWIPSIYLYDPITCKTTMTASIMRDNF